MDGSWGKYFLYQEQLVSLFTHTVGMLVLNLETPLHNNYIQESLQTKSQKLCKIT